MEHAQACSMPVPLLSFEAHVTLPQTHPHEAEEDPEAPEKERDGLSGSQGPGYHVPTLVLGFPPPPATSLQPRASWRASKTWSPTPAFLICSATSDQLLFLGTLSFLFLQMSN